MFLLWFVSPYKTTLVLHAITLNVCFKITKFDKEGKTTTYFPEMLSVPDGSRLDLLRQEQDSLEGPDPGALLDPLRCTDAVGQAGHCAGAQAHLPRQVPQPLGDLGWRSRRRSTAGAHQAPQGVEGPVHGALAIAVIGAHVTPWEAEGRTLSAPRSRRSLCFARDLMATQDTCPMPLHMVHQPNLAKPLKRNPEGSAETLQTVCKHSVFTDLPRLFHPDTISNFYFFNEHRAHLNHPSVVFQRDI